MKSLFLCFIAAIAISTQALADAIRTNILLPGDPPLTITVPAARILTVIHYLSDSSGNSTLSVTKDGKSTPILFPTDISSQNDIHNNLVIAGPATVTVITGSPVMAMGIVVTYRLDPNQ